MLDKTRFISVRLDETGRGLEWGDQKGLRFRDVVMMFATAGGFFWLLSWVASPNTRGLFG